MPLFQLMLGRLNSAFDYPAIREVPKELFEPGQSLPDLAKEYEIARTDGEASFIASVPTGIQEAVRGLIRSNLERDEPYAMTFAWAPAYDFELSIWECQGTDVSKGGITVLFRSRYPGDPLPVGGTS